jgi:hypothetical protein
MTIENGQKKLLIKALSFLAAALYAVIMYFMAPVIHGASNRTDPALYDRVIRLEEKVGAVKEDLVGIKASQARIETKLDAHIERGK